MASFDGAMLLEFELPIHVDVRIGDDLQNRVGWGSSDDCDRLDLAQTPLEARVSNINDVRR